MKPCRSTGCEVASYGYSTFCKRHRHHLARHGHPDQKAISVAELKPHIAKVAAKQRNNPDSPAWTLLEGRWNRTIEAAKVAINAANEGKTYHRPSLKAAQFVLTVAGEVSAMTVLQMYIAMHFLQRDQPFRFKSDKAFDFQLARRVRGLAKTSAGTYFNVKTGAMSRVYRDTPARATAAFASILKDTFGAAGLQLAALEGYDRDADEKKRIAEALTAFK